MKKFNNVHNKCHTTVNGNQVWESRSVAVNCLVILKIINEYFILIGKRGNGSPDNVGKWNIPSGYMDYNETGTAACYREVWEETGVDIDDIKGDVILNLLEEPWYVNTDPTENRQNISLRYGIIINTDYFPDFSFENNEPDEVAELKWVNIKHINKYDFAFKHDIVIQQFVNRFIL
jgi:8-oxo-dGTP pyrophosphatase MutT (NUDIX family)